MENITSSNCTESIQFEATGEQDISSWGYKLILRPNNKFTLNFHLKTAEKNQSDSVDDWIYEGNFTPSSYGEFYYLNFSNIYKSGTSKAKAKGKAKPIPRQQFTEEMTAKIKPDGTCEFIKEKSTISMKGNIINVKQFFETNYSNMSVLKEIDMTTRLCLAKKSNCCRIDYSGLFIDCGVPCRGDCCGYLGKLCSEPCEAKNRINAELMELYTKQMQELSDEDLNTKLNGMIKESKFEKIVLNRLKYLMPSFSNCIHQKKDNTWLTCCQICKFKITQDTACKEANNERENLMISLSKKFFKTSASQSMICEKCPYQICVYCEGIYEISLLKKLTPLHQHDLPLKTEANYCGSYCNICKEAIDRPRKRCDQCYFDVCWLCDANYMKLVASLA
jgi:hypothetical protein